MSPLDTTTVPTGVPALNAVEVVALTDRATPPDWVQTSYDRPGYHLTTRELPPPGRPDPALPLIRVVESLPGCIVYIDHRTWREPRQRKVLVAVQELPEDGAAVAEAACHACRLGAMLEIVHAVPLSYAERSVGLSRTLRRADQILDEAAHRAASIGPGLGIVTRLPRVHPHELVTADLDAHLLVLGWAHPATAPLGLVTRSALHTLPCPLLLVPSAS